MGKRLYSRIFIERDEKLFKLMNIANLKDESIVMTFYGYKKEREFWIYSNDSVDPKEISIINEEINPKITFHRSGKIKLSSRISKDGKNYDRITADSLPLLETKKSRRIMDIFIPPKLVRAEKDAFDIKQDIILCADHMPNKQWRIALFCTEKSSFEALNTPHWVSTSEYEMYASLERANLVWTWVLRTSNSDEGRTDNLKYFIYVDNLKWPAPIK